MPIAPVIIIGMIIIRMIVAAVIGVIVWMVIVMIIGAIIAPMVIISMVIMSIIIGLLDIRRRSRSLQRPDAGRALQKARRRGRANDCGIDDEGGERGDEGGRKQAAKFHSCLLWAMDWSSMIRQASKTAKKACIETRLCATGNALLRSILPFEFNAITTEP
jgi:hypothetical protein